MSGKLVRVVVSMCLLIVAAQCSPYNSLEEEDIESLLSSKLVNKIFGHIQGKEDSKDLAVSFDRVSHPSILTQTCSNLIQLYFKALICTGFKVIITLQQY